MINRSRKQLPLSSCPPPTFRHQKLSHDSMTSGSIGPLCWVSVEAAAAPVAAAHRAMTNQKANIVSIRTWKWLIRWLLPQCIPPLIRRLIKWKTIRRTSGCWRHPHPRRLWLKFKVFIHPCVRVRVSVRLLVRWFRPEVAGVAGRYFFYCFSKAENLGGKHTGGEFNEGKKRFSSSKFSIRLNLCGMSKIPNSFKIFFWAEGRGACNVLVKRPGFYCTARLGCF